MKKLLLIIAIAAGLTACEKEGPSVLDREVLPEWYYSRVRYFHDGRQPATDTVWTLRMVTDSMRVTYAGLHGYVYDQRTEWTEVGQLWEKIR